MFQFQLVPFLFFDIFIEVFLFLWSIKLGINTRNETERLETGKFFQKFFDKFFPPQNSNFPHVDGNSYLLCKLLIKLNYCNFTEIERMALNYQPH